MEQFLFALYALLACGGALAVVLSQNVVRMAFYLVIALGSTAGLFFLLDADFIGATQLLIYVGGTIVLLIFGVMLTSSSPYSSLKSTPAEILQGGIVGLAFLAVVFSTVMSVDWARTQESLRQGEQVSSLGYNPPEEGNTSRPIGMALLGLRFDQDLQSAEASVSPALPENEPATPAESSTQEAEQSPATLGTGYLLPFEIVSVHLLVVLIGASYLARAKRPQPAPG
jgi:NADH-quinone oxidoreductase subunit J